MVEVEGDTLNPSELILADDPNSSKTLLQSGAYIFGSGAAVYATVGSGTFILGS